MIQNKLTFLMQIFSALYPFFIVTRDSISATALRVFLRGSMSRSVLIMLYSLVETVSTRLTVQLSRSYTARLS